MKQAQVFGCFLFDPYLQFGEFEGLNPSVVFYQMEILDGIPSFESQFFFLNP